MKIEELINEIYNILIQYEKISEDETTEDAYLAYLDSLYVWYVGYDKPKIYNTIKGLYELGLKANHETVRRAVFKIIHLLEKDGAYGA